MKTKLSATKKVSATIFLLLNDRATCSSSKEEQVIRIPGRANMGTAFSWTLYVGLMLLGHVCFFLGSQWPFVQIELPIPGTKLFDLKKEMEPSRRDVRSKENNEYIPRGTV